jgi:hypothetical protein
MNFKGIDAVGAPAISGGGVFAMHSMNSAILVNPIITEAETP